MFEFKKMKEIIVLNNLMSPNIRTYCSISYGDCFCTNTPYSYCIIDTSTWYKLYNNINLDVISLCNQHTYMYLKSIIDNNDCVKILYNESIEEKVNNMKVLI